MKRILNIFALSAMCMAMLAGCSKELTDTEQYAKSGVVLNVYGPQPVMRGGELRFLGSNLDKVTEVIIPGVAPITEIEVVKSGVPSEIRVIVPKDGPEPGAVILRTSDGKEIVTKTELTYSEPIVLESFSPAAVKAGDILTIKGDYFNLIHEVVFSEDVLVSEKDFKSHTRYEIKVVVPLTARTGRLGLGDIDMLNNEDENAMANVIYFEEELTVAAPEVTKMSAPRYKAGETVTITGRNLNYVASIVLPGKTVTDFKVASDNASLTFVLPGEAGDGAVVLVAVSGVETEAGTIEVVVPSEVVAAPQPVKAGGVLTISGKDLDLVTAVELPNAGEVEFSFDGNISLTVPETAQEGMAILKTANGKNAEAEYSLVKPAGFSYSVNPAPAGSDITVTGTELDLVKSVTFGGDLTVEVTAAETEFTVAVPTTAVSGALGFNLANGTTIKGDVLEVEKPVACFITELPEPGTEIYGGTVLVVSVENEDKLVGVEVNGAPVNFLLNGKTLYISLPDMAGKDTVIRLVSSNGAVENIIDCIPNNIQNKVIWSGSFNAGNWAGNQDLAWDGFDWSTIDLSAGEVSLVFDITEDSSAGYWQLSLRHGQDWGDLPENSFFDLEAGQTQLEVPLTKAMLDDLIANGGLVLTGCNYTLTKITVKTVIPMAKTIWEGEFAFAWNGMDALAWGGYDWSGVTAGTVITVHFSSVSADAKLRFAKGTNWGTLPSGVTLAGGDAEGNIPIAEGSDSYSFTLTQEDADILSDTANGGLILTGTGCTLVKVTVL